jgi:hypothetical protein
LAFEEFVHALVFDGFLVFYHAHTVSYLVEFVDFCEVFTGHVWALITEAELAADFVGTVPFDERTVFVSDTAAAAMGYLAFLGWNSAAIGKVGFADAAVHAAGRDEVSSKL